MHTKYIFILTQEYIAIPVPVGDNWKGTGYGRIHCHFAEAKWIFSQSLPSSIRKAAVPPFWKHCVFQLLHVEGTGFDRFLFAENLLADIQPTDRKDLD